MTEKKSLILFVLVTMMVAGFGLFIFDSGLSQNQPGDLVIENKDNQRHDIIIRTPTENISKTVEPNSENRIRLFDSAGRYDVYVSVDGTFDENTSVKYSNDPDGGINGPVLALTVRQDGDISLGKRYDF